jgi:hypothetical protein
LQAKCQRKLGSRAKEQRRPPAGRGGWREEKNLREHEAADKDDGLEPTEEQLPELRFQAPSLKQIPMFQIPKYETSRNTG